MSEQSSFVKLRVSRYESHQVKDHPFEGLQVQEEVHEEQVRKVDPRKDERFRRGDYRQQGGERVVDQSKAKAGGEVDSKLIK